MKVFLSYIKKIIPKKIFKKIQPIYHYVISFLASLFYGNPSKKMIIIGVTGTSGKTSSVYLMAKALNDSGYKTGYTSTAMFGDGQNEWLNDKKMTMVGLFFTQKILRNMVKNKCLFAIVETTSEGIRQFRHRFINYDILVFTGLYPEHIESHGSFDNYKKTKGELFDYLKKCSTKYLDSENRVIKAKSNLAKIDLNRLRKTIIMNADDEHVSYFSSFWSEQKFFYSQNFQNDINASIVFYQNISTKLNGTSFDFIYKNTESKIENDYINKKISLKLWGDFNVTNAMPLLSLCLALNLDISRVIDNLEKIKNIPGRLELIDVGQKFLAIVDYAYEPVALKKLYSLISFLREELLSSGYNSKIIHVLGSAGGGRDKSRREIMGRMAGEMADFVIISNEDPYDENPLDIINQISLGAKEVGKVEGVNLFRVLDRQEAIKKSLSLIQEGDLFLITGKGCEQAICLSNGRKIPWDDRLILKEEIIKTMNN